MYHWTNYHLRPSREVVQVVQVVLREKIKAFLLNENCFSKKKHFNKTYSFLATLRL